MKMVMVVYNEVMDSEVIDVLQGCAMKNYTKINKVHGRGTASGVHMGSEIWPGENNILYVACEKEDAEQLFKCIGALRNRIGKEGIKAFMWELDKAT